MSGTKPPQHADGGVRVNIYCIRHAQAGAEHVWQYAPEKIKSLGLPLSKLGQQQVAKLSNYLSTVHFDHIYGSDLLRAYETAQIILEHHDYASINIMADIREVHAWDLDQSKKPASKLAAKEQQRVSSFARLLSEYESGEQVLVVSHGNFIRKLLAELGAYEEMGAPYFEIYNASLTSVFIDNKNKLHIKEANNTHYLTDAEKSLT